MLNLFCGHRGRLKQDITQWTSKTETELKHKDQRKGDSAKMPVEGWTYLPEFHFWFEPLEVSKTKKIGIFLVVIRKKKAEQV